MSEAGIRKQVAWLQASAGEMEGKFDYDALDPEAQLSWDLWKKQAELAQAGLPFLEDGYPFDQMNGMQSQAPRSEEHTSELQSLMRISYAVFCLKKKKKIQ